MLGFSPLSSAPLADTGQPSTEQITLTASAGAFTLTGQDALKAVSEAVAVASYTLTGQNALLTSQRAVAALSTSFSVVGVAAQLKFLISRVVVENYSQQSTFGLSGSITITNENYRNSVEIDSQDSVQIVSTMNSVQIPTKYNEAA